MRAGVPVELQVYADAFHAFDLVARAKVSLAARRDNLAALKSALHPIGAGGASGRALPHVGYAVVTIHKNSTENLSFTRRTASVWHSSPGNGFNLPSLPRGILESSVR